MGSQRKGGDGWIDLVKAEIISRSPIRRQGSGSHSHHSDAQLRLSCWPRIMVEKQADSALAGVISRGVVLLLRVRLLHAVQGMTVKHLHTAGFFQHRLDAEKVSGACNNDFALIFPFDQFSGEVQGAS